jgi:DNA-binding CsgD family transcriptional regulator
MVGALVHLAGAARTTPATCTARSSNTAAQFGWSSLTDTELGIVEQVAAGRTNWEVGAQLHLSPYTVDSHLRHNYTKLVIGSRFRLTRMLITNRPPTALDRCGAPRDRCARLSSW